MRTILVSGGNSGIGLEAARTFLAGGHRVIILGRDRRKGEEALSSFGKVAERAAFLPVDLSTHAGVRDAAGRVLAESERLDAVLHSTGVFTPNRDIRTADGLNLYFAVNYLSRYHLTQLLLPSLGASEHGRVVMMNPKVDPATRVELELFPDLDPFDYKRVGDQVSACNHHYAAYLASENPGIVTGVVNAGAVKTDILRLTPWHMRGIARVMGPFFFNSVTESAHNAVEACLRDNVPSATYWEKPGDFDHRRPIVVDAATTAGVIGFSEAITGA